MISLQKHCSNTLSQLSFIVLLLLVYNNGINAQNEIPSETKRQKWALMVETNGGFTGALIVQKWMPFLVDRQPAFFDYTDYINYNDNVPKLTIDYGILLEYYFKDNISIQGGVRWVNWGYDDPKVEWPREGRPGMFKGTTNLYYIELPFKYNYYLALKKSKVYLSVGAYPSISQGGQYIAKYCYTDEVGGEVSSENDRSVDEYKINMILEWTMGWEKSLGKHCAFYIQSNLRVQALKKQEYDSTALFFYGIGTGFKVKV